LDAQGDKALVKAAIDGDRAAFGDLVHRYSRKVFAVCLGLLGTVEDAEDVAQETFLKGLNDLGQLGDCERFGAWIVSIARNLSVDNLRRRKRARDLMAERNRQRHDVDESFIELHDALAQLPEKYRLPLVLYYIDGRSSENVASVLEISKEGVLTRLSRARKELRRLLEGKEEDKVHGRAMRRHS
jgi:RNA polymerase sigma-70 factor (ECF subfamily)